MKKKDIRYLGKKKPPEIEIPNLLEAQIRSYEAFLQSDTPPEERLNEGLESSFRKFFPIANTNGTVRVEYRHFVLEPPAYTAAECKASGQTYGKALRISLRIVKEKKGSRELVQARETGKGHEVFLGIIPQITDKGTFVINGVERVIISRLQRSPGVYFKEESASPREYSARIIPNRGAWLDFRFDGTNILYAYLGKKKIPAPDFFSALGFDNPSKLNDLIFPDGKEGEGYDLWMNTLEQHPLSDPGENIQRIYALLRPGYPTSGKKAQEFFQQLFFDPLTYELSEAGRKQLNKKLKLDSGNPCLENGDITATVAYLMTLYRNRGSVDDVDHLGNKRVRLVGELVNEQVAIGLARLSRLIRDRLNLRKNEETTPQDLINSRTFSATVKDFFARSPYSQLLDQTNPLSELTHKRRMTAIGEGVFANRKRIGFEIRDVHYTHYGRICPIETPEGGNIGILTSFSVLAQVDELGFLRTPYHPVTDGKISDEVCYLSADEEDNLRVAPASVETDEDNRITAGDVMVRHWDDFLRVQPSEINFVDVSPMQMLSVAASLIPFLEHDDANRALMGANMQRQALPLLKPQAPLVRTGSEDLVIRDAETVLRAKRDGTVRSVDATSIVIENDDARPGDFETDTVYRPAKFEHLNQDTVFNQRPLVRPGQKVRRGDALTDGPSVDGNGQLALGRNVLVAFMPWYGYNFEDAIVISEKLAREDAYTSIHITEFEVEARETELGTEEITRDIPNIAEDLLANLDEEGIVRIGAHVKPNDILVGKITPKSETELTPEERLLRVIFGEKAREVDNTSLYVPPGVNGVVVNIKKFERVQETRKGKAGKEVPEKNEAAEKEALVDLEHRENVRRLLQQAAERLNEILPPGRQAVRPNQRQIASLKESDPRRQEAIEQIRQGLAERIAECENEARKKKHHIRQGDELKVDVVRKIVVQLAIKKPVSVGDKMSGRHGNKGVIARIVPEEDMPFLPDGTPVEIVLNPLGVPSRMNVGQILETHLGWAAKTLGISVVTPVFNSTTEKGIKKLLREAGLPEDGKTVLYDGNTGEPLEEKVTCGYIYMMKLFHLADDKIHARSVGSYSLVTQQPLGGRAQFGGQRFGEMEVWALEGYGASSILQEILTVKSDDMVGRKKIYENIVKDRDFDDYQTPESFNVLINELKGLGFDVRTVTGPEGREAVTIELASPETIRKWSHGEVKKPETINYRTYKCEKDGLFCEKIFGPTRDWECNCGKYKKVKHRGITCDRCGVEVTNSDVRRTRLGHIELAAPVSYVWIFKSVHNWMGTLLNLSQNALELVLYYERYIVIDPGDAFHDEDGRKPVREKELLDETRYHELRQRYPELRAGTGAEAIGQLLGKINLKAEEALPELEENKANQEQRRNLIKKIRLVKGLIMNETRPDWMITDVIPVIPPNLRPLLPMDGGRFAASDLNDLYQRIINRNNRLKRLKKLHAPDIIIRNEQRMLQEAVDALFDNGKHGAQFMGRNNRPLKSLSESLRGKQGRFRQNLLGKRVDYSGRAVIVAGPELSLNECGLPKHMALELFAPFILRELRYREYIHTIASAKRALERNDPEVWEILEQVTRKHPILLNRQPTLHRLGIQSFFPRLIEGNVIKLHPLACAAFNADFDGDQMAIHVPLSTQSQIEAQLLMSASTHMFSPANGRPVANLSREALLGCYYLTLQDRTAPAPDCVFASPTEVVLAIENGSLRYHQPIRVRVSGNRSIETTPGRVLFNEILPPEIDFQDTLLDNKVLGALIREIYLRCGQEKTAAFLDEAKDLGFRIATTHGLTIGIDDLSVPAGKSEMIRKTAREITSIRREHAKGVITDGERYHKVIDAWSYCTTHLSDELFRTLQVKLENDFEINPIFLMVQSGARGNRQQVSQLMAMRGLMTKPTKKITGGIGEIIESPVLSNFREGLDVLEYFISTHGGRKGLVDTALKTSESGYLSRRLVDVGQNIVVSMEDCGTTAGIFVSPVWEGDRLMVPLKERIVGRVSVNQIADLVTDELIVAANREIDESAAAKIEELGIEKIAIRSVLTCKAPRGVCRKCYGYNLATHRMVDVGEAVGVVAAQSIGEPGTQLTLRTFHIGGTASRIIGGHQVLARKSGRVKFQDVTEALRQDGRRVIIKRDGLIMLTDTQGRDLDEHYPAEAGDYLMVSEGDEIAQGTAILERDPYMVPIVAGKPGRVRYEDLKYGETFKETAGTATTSSFTHKVIIAHREHLTPAALVMAADGDGEKVVDYHYLPVDAHLIAADGEEIEAGSVIAKTPRTITRVQDITGGLPRVSELFEARRPKQMAILSEIDGEVSIDVNERHQRVVKVRNIASEEQRTYPIPAGRHLLVVDGNDVRAGDKLTEGSASLDDLLRIGGEQVVAEYLLDKVQSVYRLEGVTINDKHIECIIRQMLSRVRVDKPGDTLFRDGEIISRTRAEEENRKAEEAGKQRAVTEPLVLGITRVALISESFISAASFQETLRVLTDAALMGTDDPLSGIKENVILGRLMPAGTGFFHRGRAQKRKQEEDPFASVFGDHKAAGQDPLPENTT